MLVIVGRIWRDWLLCKNSGCLVVVVSVEWILVYKLL